jgi:hypothetical protein
MILFLLSAGKKSATPKTVNAKLIYNKDGKLVTTDLGEIDLSKEPKHDPACIQFSNDLYQRFSDSIKLHYDNLQVEFTGDGKDISVYVLRARPMSQKNYNKHGQIESEIDSRENAIVYTYDDSGRQVSAKHNGDEVNCCGNGGYGKTFYNQFDQVSANLALDGRLTIFGYNKLRQQDRSYLGAIAEIKNGEYKFADLPIGDEFDIFVTKNNLTDENNINNEKLILADLIFIKDTTFKATALPKPQSNYSVVSVLKSVLIYGLFSRP